ncbi:MAG TPA: HAD family hydrolase [Polyangiales bacterium]|nr:HAD family hydrolase [Polyangiales bacterium]
MSSRLCLNPRQQADELNRVLYRIRAAAQRAPRVLFDLDGTLIDNRPRTAAIFTRLAERWASSYPELAAGLGNAAPGALVFSVRENLARMGVSDPERVLEALEFWKDHFFFDELLVHDVPAPGALEFARQTYQAGATLVYFTGRDLPNMALGTLRSLRDAGFPIGVPGVELVLKPDADTHDFEYKKAMMREVERGGEVVAGFDNEPMNCNLFKRSFPRADVYLLDTGHLPNAPELDPEIRVLGSFVT